MAIRTIEDRARQISGILAADFSDANVTNYAEPISLAYFNEVMDESLTITSSTTSDDFADEILSWLVASFICDEVRRDKMYKDTGLLESEAWQQRALELMYVRNPTKVQEGKYGRWIVREPDVSHTPWLKVLHGDGDAGGTLTEGSG